MGHTGIKQKLSSLEGVVYKLLRASLSAAAGYIISKATLFSILSPFSVALLAVSPFAGVYPAAVYIGSAVGFITKPFSVYNFKYICADTIMLVIVLIAGKKNYRKNIYTAILPAIVCLACGGIFLFAERFTVYDVLLIICEAVICGCFSYFLGYFINAVRKQRTLTARDLISFNISLLAAICALDSIYVYGFSMSLVFTVVVILLCAYYLKSGAAAVFTLPLCFVYSLLHSANDNFIIILYVPALITIAVVKWNKRYTYAAYVLPYLALCASLGRVSVFEYQVYCAPLIASLLFMLVPKDRLAVFLSKYIDVAQPVRANSLNTCDELCEKFKNDANELVKEISFTRLDPIISENNEAKIKRALVSFGYGNISVANYTNVEGRQTAALYFKSEKEPDVKEIAKRLSQVTGKKLQVSANASNGTSRSVKLEPLHEYTVDCHALYKAKRGETVCGDCVTAFRTSNQTYVMLIADGMGSGDQAFSKSSSAVTMIKKLLAVGAAPASVLGSVNAALGVIKDEIGFSTIDLCSISLETGIAEFYKCGAFTSYILRKNKLITVNTGGFPAGLDFESNYSYFSTKLEDGDVIVMMSDGVSPAIEKLQAKMLMSDCREPAMLSRQLIDCAYNEIAPEYDDDMTVLAAEIRRNGNA